MKDETYRDMSSLETLFLTEMLALLADKHSRSKSAVIFKMGSNLGAVRLPSLEDHLAYPQEVGVQTNSHYLLFILDLSYNI